MRSEPRGRTRTEARINRRETSGRRPEIECEREETEASKVKEPLGAGNRQNSLPHSPGDPR